MGNLIFDEETQEKIRQAKLSIKTRADREEFSLEVRRELWDLMPFDAEEISRIVNKVAYRYTHGGEDD